MQEHIEHRSMREEGKHTNLGTMRPTLPMGWDMRWTLSTEVGTRCPATPSSSPPMWRHLRADPSLPPYAVAPRPDWDVLMPRTPRPQKCRQLR